MINVGNRIIHVDFSITTRDLFRANLALSKVRLILGLGFSLCLISGLVVFFLMIDEQLILLETSPLFVGLPLLAVGGQVLRLHALCRKYVSRLTESQRRMHYMFSLHGDGYDVASGELQSHLLERCSQDNREAGFLSDFSKRIRLPNHSQARFSPNLGHRSSARNASLIDWR